MFVGFLSVSISKKTTLAVSYTFDPTYHLLTFFSPFLARAVNMVFELDPHLALGGLVSDKGVLE